MIFGCYGRVYVALRWESVRRSVLSVVVRCKGIEASHLDAGVQEYDVQPAAQPGVPEHFPVDTAGDSEVRERASFNLRALRSRGAGT